MAESLDRLSLAYNPFEPSASGPPVRTVVGARELWVPARWRTRITDILDRVETGQGVKALAIQGEYGSGKTYLLNWLATEELPRRGIRSFFFDNPGVQFYDLANSLFKQIGRYEFTKMLWEYLSPQLTGFQQPLIGEDGVIGWLRSVKRFKQQEQAKSVIADTIRQKQITTDDEIAYRLARVVVETIDQPYFQYQDFVAGRQHAIVAEKEEAPYFTAIIRILKSAGGANAVAFLLDEFEGVSLQKRLTRKQAYDYLATLRRLINVAYDDAFWLILAMTRQAAEISQQLEPALWERFTSQGEYEFIIPPLNEDEAKELLHSRLARARTAGAPSELFPFSEDFTKYLQPRTYSSPRQVVKVAFYAVAEASQDPRIELPFQEDFLRRVERNVVPIPIKPPNG